MSEDKQPEPRQSENSGLIERIGDSALKEMEETELDEYVVGMLDKPQALKLKSYISGRLPEDIKVKALGSQHLQSTEYNLGYSVRLKRYPDTR